MIGVAMACFAAWTATLASGSADATEPRAAPAGDAIAARLSDRVDAPCGPSVRRELALGTADPKGCIQARPRLPHRRSPQAPRFGYVDERSVSLATIDLQLGLATACATWPLRRRDRETLSPRDVADAGCRGRAWEGPLSLGLVDARGEVLPGPVSMADKGRVTVSLSQLDRWLRARGRSLEQFQRLDLGADAWAGSLNLLEHRERLARWHLRSVRRGRGAAGLFAVRHPEGDGAEIARALSLEEDMQRQRADYRAVLEGRMSPAAFLGRHTWSPFRRPVADLAAGLRRREDLPPVDAVIAPQPGEGTMSRRRGGESGGGAPTHAGYEGGRPGAPSGQNPT